MRIKKLEHKGYTEWNKARITHPELKMSRYFGRWQYICSKYWGEMSVVHLEVGALKRPTFMWEVARLHWGKYLAMYWQRLKSTKLYFKYEDWRNRDAHEKDKELLKLFKQSRKLFGRRPVCVEIIARFHSRKQAIDCARKELRFWHMLWRTFVWRP